MKNWQHGFELDYLKEIEKKFESWNYYAQHELTKFKKNTIAPALANKEVIIEDDSLVHWKQTKVKTKVEMLPGLLCAERQPGDIIVHRIAYGSETDTVVNILKTYNVFRDNAVFLHIHEESENDKKVAEESGFKRVGVKYSSVADMIGVYFRDKPNTLFDRDFPKIEDYHYYGLKKAKRNYTKEIEQLSEEFKNFTDEFTNHYSNYNKNKSWSALSLRGYTSDPAFITKPSEMNKKWQEENKDVKFEMQDTLLREKFPVVETILNDLPKDKIHRIRFMKLKPGGGELERHTDQVDTDSGIGDGQLMRLHYPIITNENVIFKCWTPDNGVEVVNMKPGEMWFLDTRKPHSAVNGGNQERTHLVVDVESSEKTRTLLVS